jgi:hypothetical protein
MVKRKIGTQVDDVLFVKVKVLSARERRPIGEIVELALADYVDRARRKSRAGRSGLLRFLDSPAFRLTDKQFRETLEADFYDQ